MGESLYNFAASIFLSDLEQWIIIALLQIFFMSEDVLFEEEQTFRQKWIDVLLLSIAIMLLIVFTIVVLRKGDDSKEASLVLLTALALIFLIRALVKNSRLITKIAGSGIYVRFPPLLPSLTQYSWNDIQEVYLREYNPLGEYGGWGIRFGLKGRAFNVSGNIGLQIVFKDGSRVLIGTNRPEQMADIPNRLGKVKP